ncbi:hypothetical protein ACH5RR_023345 [Cinchona calisaya]|uniref:Uncharacterized protein n=1 Tax=Cinchona calisaya TaxID=153742 RepID=A0ABD2ZBH3_9GENT
MQRQYTVDPKIYGRPGMVIDAEEILLYLLRCGNAKKLEWIKVVIEQHHDVHDPMSTSKLSNEGHTEHNMKTEYNEHKMKNSDKKSHFTSVLPRPSLFIPTAQFVTTQDFFERIKDTDWFEDPASFKSCEGTSREEPSILDDSNHSISFEVVVADAFLLKIVPLDPEIPKEDVPLELGTDKIARETQGILQSIGHKKYIEPAIVPDNSSPLLKGSSCLCSGCRWDLERFDRYRGSSASLAEEVPFTDRELLIVKVLELVDSLGIPYEEYLEGSSPSSARKYGTSAPRAGNSGLGNSSPSTTHGDSDDPTV